jgi:L-arabinokinase
VSTIAFYVSGHGFGHASRDIEVLNELGRRHPEITVIVRTSAPRWIFDLTLTRPVDWRPKESDTGVVQLDSLRLDARETIRQAEAFHAALDEDAAREAAWLREQDATLVVGDIPPLAFAAAAQAGIRSVALGNFTWDWIYAGYPEQLSPSARLVERLRDAYSHAALALRLPMAGGFDMFSRVVDLPFIARRSTRRPADVRRQLQLADDRPLVLLSFGGYGLSQIDLMRLSKLVGYTIVTTSDVTANRRTDDPPGLARMLLPANIEQVDERALYSSGLRYEDLVAAVDIVVTKPGYGIIAECIANNTAILYTSRGQFVEYDVLVREMPRWLRCQFISNEDLLGGRWQDALDRLRKAPPPPERIATDGAERAVEWIAGISL